MRHQVDHKKLGRTTPHRWAMFRNMATSLVERERITTTLSKAKELRFFADYLVSLGKQNDLSARRIAIRFVRSRAAMTKIFSDLAPRFKTRHGGYTRILKLGYRHGDGAPMALIEYLPSDDLKEQKMSKKTKGSALKKPQKPQKTKKKDGDLVKR